MLLLGNNLVRGQAEMGKAECQESLHRLVVEQEVATLVRLLADSIDLPRST